MSELGDDFKAWDDQKKAKKVSNKEQSTQLLIDRGVNFTSHGGGIHLKVHSDHIGIIDFWPSTGKFKTKQGKQGRGVFKLLKLL